MYIVHYKGPTKYQATEPVELWDSIFKIPRSWDHGIADNLTIDGKKGATWEDFGNKISDERYTIRYDLDPETFIAIIASGKWDEAKDLSLFEETLHITKGDT